jgi:glucan 1,3-beta-glucosidase
LYFTNKISWGTAVEHHTKYQYQFVDTREIFLGQAQTETAYYQPNPDATIPFPYDAARYDPVFTPSSNSSVNAASGWGLRILRSNNILGYGVGLYSFFDNYSTKCSDIFAGAICQTRILSIEGQERSYDINLYNLNTVGTTQMITRDGVDLASNVDNNSTFVDTINVFRIGTNGL